MGDGLTLLVVVGLWLILQFVVLPRFGAGT